MARVRGRSSPNSRMIVERRTTAWTTAERAKPRISAHRIWFWHTFRDPVTLCGSNGCEDAAAEQVEVGAAVHLPLDHFDAVDLSFDGAGAPGGGGGGGSAGGAGFTPVGEGGRAG